MNLLRVSIPWFLMYGKWNAHSSHSVIEVREAAINGWDGAWGCLSQAEWINIHMCSQFALQFWIGVVVLGLCWLKALVISWSSTYLVKEKVALLSMTCIISLSLSLCWIVLLIIHQKQSFSWCLLFFYSKIVNTCCFVV